MDIDRAVDEIFELAERERYVYSDSDKSFDAIAGLWFLGDEFEKTLAEIVKYRIISTFLLDALGYFYKTLVDEYDIPSMSAIDLTNADKVASLQEALGKLKNNKRFIQWCTNLLLPSIEGILCRVKVEDLCTVSNIGNIADSILRAGKHAIMYPQSGMVDDMVFEFAAEVMSFLREGDEGGASSRQ